MGTSKTLVGCLKVVWVETRLLIPVMMVLPLLIAFIAISCGITRPGSSPVAIYRDALTLALLMGSILILWSFTVQYFVPSHEDVEIRDRALYRRLKARFEE
jgi:hypothetical protein